MASRYATRGARTGALLALGAVLGCAPAGEPWELAPAQLELDAPVRLPLRSDSLPLVEVQVDGCPALALLDTGAESTLIDAAFAARCGLAVVPLRGPVVSRREGEVARVYDAFVDRPVLELGDARATGLRPLVLDMAYFGRGIEVLVGQDVLASCAVLFDAPAGEIRLLPPADLVRHLGDVFAVGTRFTCFPWARDEPRAFLPLRFEGDLAFDALIDTGAVFSAFPTEVVSALALEEVEGHTSRHIGGEEDEATYRLPRLVLGEVTLTELDISAWDEDTGILGYAALQHFAFVVDGVGRQFCFAYEPARVDEAR